MTAKKPGRHSYRTSGSTATTHLSERLFSSIVVVILAALVGTSGCIRSPEALLGRHLERGDRYFKGESYRDAVIEYRNALRFDSDHIHAIRQLGLSHVQLGEFGQAVRYLVRAQDLDGDNAEVRFKLGTIYLMAGRAEDARIQAEAVLEREPYNLDALLLAAGAAATPDTVEATIARFETVRARLDRHARFHLALSTLYLKRADDRAAERSLREAVRREPSSVEVRLALGTFLLGRDNLQAEGEFKKAAELGSPGSTARLRLADFYVLIQRPEDARRVLIDVTNHDPDALPAWRRLATVSLSEGKLDETSEILKTILRQSPSDIEAHLLRGRVHLARRQVAEAIQDFLNVLKLEPRLFEARFQLALAHTLSGNLRQAVAELKEVTTLAPGFAEAALVLAELNIQSGAVQSAIDDLERLLVRYPNLVQAHLLLASAHTRRGDVAKAEAVYRRLAIVAPQDPRAPHLLGAALARQGRHSEARKELERSLALAPAFVDPLVQLVTLDFAERRPDSALARVRKQIREFPQSGLHQNLLGDVHRARGDLAGAEAAYLKAIELQPRLATPYVELGRLYAATARAEKGLTKLEELLTLDPNHVLALMEKGFILEQAGDFAGARQAYERVLVLQPGHVLAANNLAWILAERGGDRDVALQLAQKAKEAEPWNPAIAHTLGWILHRRGLHDQALVLLKESAAKLPANAEVHYHLGVVAASVGDKEVARRALSVAAAAKTSFAGQDEARRVLGELK